MKKSEKEVLLREISRLAEELAGSPEALRQVAQFLAVRRAEAERQKAKTK